ncbi:unnamed protein product [Linum trigynum]|uniref:Uncharacterized protein n=1 Tax=Linum trigynum TaxID=586398 RepID=A0AAV2FRS6_9ROSI
MAVPNQHATSLRLAQGAIFNGKGFEDAAGYARYLHQFQDRPLHPSITLDPSKFNRYGMDIPRLINTLGWGDILPNRNYGFRPEVVRMFYANMKTCLHISPPCFTTIVYNYLITLNVELLSLLLGIPISGAEVMNELDFHSVEFNEGDALRLYTRDIGRYYPSEFHSGRLRDDLKVLHFYTTRLFLPRSFGLNTIYPTDLWILASAKENRVISYPHLMFDHMLNYHADNFEAELPFAPQITQILLALGIDLRFKVARVDMLSSLRAQFILRKVDASVGRRGPVVVNAPGGDTAAHEFPEDGLSLAELDGDEAVREPELPIRDNGKRPMVDPLEEVQAMFRQEEASSSRNLIMEDDDDISDYVPSPKFAY